MTAISTGVTRIVLVPWRTRNFVEYTPVYVEWIRRALPWLQGSVGRAGDFKVHDERWTTAEDVVRRYDGRALAGDTAVLILTDEPLPESGWSSRLQRKGIVSTAMLSPRKLRCRLVHEIGHLIGLYHCRSVRCFMTSDLDVRNEFACRWDKACARTLKAMQQKQGLEIGDLADRDLAKVELQRIRPLESDKSQPA